MKWSAAISFFVLAFRAASEEVSTGPHDILAMLQSSLRVKTSIDTTSPSNDTESPQSGPQMDSVSHLEEMVLSRIQDGKLEGDIKLAGTINKSIKNMFTSIISATQSNQKLMEKSIRAFKKCKVDMWGNYGKALPLEKKHWILKNIYPKCIRAENILALDNRKVQTTYKTAKNLYDNTKKLMQVKGKTCTNRCTNLRNENYHEQLQRLVGFYKKCKAKLGPLGEQLAKAKKAYVTAHKKHYITSAKYKAMLKKCKKIAYLMNWRKCQSVTKLQTGCKGYGQCWKIALANYNKNAALVREQEKNMKIQWRTLKRIQCYLQVIDDKPAKDKKGKKIPNKVILEGCIKMKRPDTKHLDIDYLKIPKKPKCPKDKMCPCTPFYINSAGSYEDHQCGLRLLNVTEADAGTWRCEMEEYKFGDWVSGVRHEAEVELEVIRNPEVDPEIIFIDDDADDTIKTKQVKNLGQLKPENRRINSEMESASEKKDPSHTIVTVLILVSLTSLVFSLMGALKYRRCRHSMQKLDDPETWRAKELMESAPMTMSDLAIMEK